VVLEAPGAPVLVYLPQSKVVLVCDGSLVGIVVALTLGNISGTFTIKNAQQFSDKNRNKSKLQIFKAFILF
jgi:hypothetical protein